MKSSFQASVLLSSIFLSSCVLAIGTDGMEEDMADWAEAEQVAASDASGTMDGEAIAMKAPSAKEDKKAAEKADTSALEFDLMMAELELAAAEASQARSMESAQHGIATAKRDLGLAMEELAHFSDVDMPLAAAESELSLDRTRGRLNDSKAELQQLVEMYGDEEFAESTKELVLTRGKRGVEQGERSMKIAERRATDKREFELARKGGSLAFKVSEAERSLALKVDALATTKMDGKSKLMRAANKVEKAKKKLTDATAEAN